MCSARSRPERSYPLGGYKAAGLDRRPHDTDHPERDDDDIRGRCTARVLDLQEVDDDEQRHEAKSG
eukprot:9243393-Pyramimonas_sp.AAC.1